MTLQRKSFAATQFAKDVVLDNYEHYINCVIIIIVFQVI